MTPSKICRRMEGFFIMERVNAKEILFENINESVILKSEDKIKGKAIKYFLRRFKFLKFIRQ